MKIKSCSVILMAVVLTVGCKKVLKRDELFAAQGCMAGGFGAAALVYIKDFGKSDVNENAVIAGMMGCMAGAVIGHKIARKTQSYVDAETAANEEIAQNEKSTKQLRKYNQGLATNISDYEQQIATIKQSKLSAKEKTKNLKETKGIVSKQKKKAETSLISVKKEIATSEEVFAKYQADASREDTTEWETEIASLNQERVILSQHVQTLSALDASI